MQQVTTYNYLWNTQLLWFREWPTKIYTLSYIMYPFVGGMITFIVGSLVSVITGGRALSRLKMKSRAKFYLPFPISRLPNCQGRWGQVPPPTHAEVKDEDPEIRNGRQLQFCDECWQDIKPCLTKLHHLLLLRPPLNEGIREQSGGQCGHAWGGSGPAPSSLPTPFLQKINLSTRIVKINMTHIFIFNVLGDFHF